MKPLKQSFYLLSLLSLAACSSDSDTAPEDPSTEDPTTVTPPKEEPLTQEDYQNTLLFGDKDAANQAETTLWKMQDAQLVNTSGTMAVADAFNIKDDVFEFAKKDGTIEITWKPGHDINPNAATAAEVALDYYQSPKTFTVAFENETDLSLTADDGNLRFVMDDQGGISGTIIYPEQSASGKNSGSQLQFDLTKKDPLELATVPQGSLNFTPAFTFKSAAIFGMAPGMIGSYSDNSLFIVTREREVALAQQNGNPERIIKFDFDTNNLTDNYYNQIDFVSKQLHIVNNQLYAVGAQYINTYDLSLANAPQTVSHGIIFSRHGMAVQNNTIYAIGGRLAANDQTNDGQTIFKWDIGTPGGFVPAFTVPERLSGARGTIVNNKLYIFGGTEEFFGPNPRSTIYIIDLSDGSMTTENMTQTANFTFVDKHDHLIYVGGRKQQTVGQTTTYSAFLGVYDTTDNSFTEIPTNLDDANSDADTMHALSIFNNKLYVLYGAWDSPKDANNQIDWTVYETPLN